MNFWNALTVDEKDKIKALSILLVAMTIGIAYYDMSFVAQTVKVNKAAVKRHDDAYRLEKESLDKMKSMVSDKDRLLSRKALLEKVVAKLPSNTDPSGFFQALEGILRITRMESEQLDRTPERASDEYTEIPYRIISRARYHDFGQFLNLIEENPTRLMRVKTFIVENDDSRPSIHPVNVQVATFMFNR
jgi:Tfp pilus assembly protein PilO